MQRIRTYLVTLASIMALALPVMIPGVAMAAPSPCSGNDAKGQVLQGAGAVGDECNPAGFTNAIRTAVNIVSIIAGIIAVIMVIVAGFKYITSGGSSEKVASAKSTLIYALLGVAVVTLAQFLVHYVFTVSKQAT